MTAETDREDRPLAVVDERHSGCRAGGGASDRHIEVLCEPGVSGDFVACSIRIK